jgi:hypothetical protein
MSGSAVLSNRMYYNGEFEFKMQPSMASGVATVLGLANDGITQTNPFIQLVFDYDLYGVDSFAIQLGGAASSNLFGDGSTTKQYTVNVSQLSAFQSAFNGT